MGYPIGSFKIGPIGPYWPHLGYSANSPKASKSSSAVLFNPKFPRLPRIMSKSIQPQNLNGRSQHAFAKPG